MSLKNEILVNPNLDFGDTLNHLRGLSAKGNSCLLGQSVRVLGTCACRMVFAIRASTGRFSGDRWLYVAFQGVVYGILTLIGLPLCLDFLNWKVLILLRSKS